MTMNIHDTFHVVLVVIFVLFLTAGTAVTLHKVFIAVRTGLSKVHIIAAFALFASFQFLLGAIVSQTAKKLGESGFNHRYTPPRDFGGEVKDVWIGESAFPSALGGKKIRLAQDGTNTYLLFLSEEDESRRMLRVVVKEMEIPELPTAFLLK
ncbi:MAG: hypothetical protein Q8P86_01975 [bacterium]|nr:hypothetical protein [bacterium]